MHRHPNACLHTHNQGTAFHPEHLPVKHFHDVSTPLPTKQTQDGLISQQPRAELGNAHIRHTILLSPHPVDTTPGCQASRAQTANDVCRLVQVSGLHTIVRASVPPAEEVVGEPVTSACQ